VSTHRPAERSKTPGFRVKRIYEPASTDDGFRVLVDRLWPRGLSKQKAHIDAWLKERRATRCASNFMATRRRGRISLPPIGTNSKTSRQRPLRRNYAREPNTSRSRSSTPQATRTTIMRSRSRSGWSELIRSRPPRSSSFERLVPRRWAIKSARTARSAKIRCSARIWSNSSDPASQLLQRTGINYGSTRSSLARRRGKS
jgi:hypothetical protein